MSGARAVVSVLLLFVLLVPLVAQNSIDLRAAKSIGTVDLSRLPLTFERCKGTDGELEVFCHRSVGYAMFFTPTEMTFVSPMDPSDNKIAGQRQGLKKLTIHLVNANRHASAFPTQDLPGKSSYLIGRNSRQWRKDVAQYQRLTYRNVYSGIDVAYHGSGRNLEYDFEVTPRASVSRIKMRFSTTERLAIADTGELLTSEGGPGLRLQKPRAFQRKGNATVDIPVSYMLLGPREVGFKVGRYDHSKPLIIDPVVGFSTYFTGGLGQWVFGLTLDSAGNIYAAGTTVSADLETLNPIQGQLHGIDGFIVKLDPTASTLLYSTFLGGKGMDEIHAIAVDHDGNIYVAGATDSVDFPVANALQGAITKSCPVNPPETAYQPPCRDAFVTKLDPTGSRLLYSTFLGGSADDYAHAIAVDTQENAYVGGGTRSSDFPVLGTSDAIGAAFLSKMDPSGKLLFSTRWGGSGNSDNPAGDSVTESADALALDFGGNVYVTGSTTSLDFSLLNPLQVVKSTSGMAAFLTKFSNDGTMAYSTFLGSPDSEGNSGNLQIGFVQGTGIGVDGAGNVLVTGTTDESPNHMFLTKVSPDGSQLLFAKRLAGNGGDAPAALAIDPLGNIAVTGSTQSLDFPVLNATQEMSKQVLVKSTDQGATWQSFNRGLVPSVITGLAFDSSGKIFAESREGAFLSQDSGANWAQIQTGEFDGWVYDNGDPPTIFAMRLGSGLWRSSDGGVTFTQAAGRGLSYDNFHFLSLAYASQPSGTLWAVGAWLDLGGTTPSGLFKSTNQGDDWNLVTSLPFTYSPGAALNFVIVAPKSPSTLYVLGGRPDTESSVFLTAFYKSVDGGLNWTSTDLHSDSVEPMNVLTFDPADSSILYVAGRGGYFKSADGGNTWSAGPGQSSSQFVVAFAVSPTNSSVLYQSCFNPVPGLYKSADGGSTWNLTSIVNRLPSVIAFDPLNPSIMYVSLNSNWFAQSLVGDGDAFLSLFDPNGNLIFSTYLGGTGFDTGQAVAFTPSGDLVLAGYSASGDFPTTSGAYQPVYSAGLVPQPYTNSPCANSFCPQGDFYKTPASGFITGFQKLGLRSDSSSVTLHAGGSQTVNITVIPRIGDKNAPVMLSCSGLPNESTCQFSSSEIMPTTTPVTVSMTLRTTGNTVAATPANRRRPFGLATYLCLMPFLFAGIGYQSRSRSWQKRLILVALAGAFLMLTSCGSHSSGSKTVVSGTTPGTYQVMVTASWGTNQTSTQITMTVQ